MWRSVAGLARWARGLGALTGALALMVSPSTTCLYNMLEKATLHLAGLLGVDGDVGEAKLSQG